MIRAIETKGKTLISIENVQRIDKQNINELTERLEGYVKKNHQLYLNLNKVFFIDAEGFLRLLELQKKAKKADCSIKLFQISDALSELFNLMELYDKFEWANPEHVDPAFCNF